MPRFWITVLLALVLLTPAMPATAAKLCTEKDYRQILRLINKAEYAEKRLENGRVKDVCRNGKTFSVAVSNLDIWLRKNPQCSQATKQARHGSAMIRKASYQIKKALKSCP